MAPTSRVLFSLLATALCLPRVQASVREAEVTAPGNPHIPSKQCAATGQCAAAGACECPAQHLGLSSANIVPRLSVQQDTFARIETKRVSGVEINIYHFKQPERLSALELPFKILPLRAIELSDVVAMEVPAENAMDSWFPGYAWSVLVCKRCEGTHIGWKFTPTGTTGGQAFYALIVESIDKEQEDPLSTAAQTERLFASIRVAGRPLAALGLAASALHSISAA